MREHKYEGGILYLKCSMCGELKGAESFNRDRHKEFGYRNECKYCRKPKRKLYYEANRDKIIEHVQIWVDKNRDKSTEYKKKYAKSHKEHITKHMRENSNRHTEELGFSWHTFHRKANQFVKRWGFKPLCCPICGGNNPVIMHHPSYEKFEDWSIVVFCCRRCHNKIHTGLIECPHPVNLLEMNRHV